MSGCEAAGAAAGGAAAVSTASAVANTAGAVIVGTGELIVGVATLGQMPKPEPTTELSRKEQINLLSQMQQDPNRVGNLTDRERRYLGKLIIASEDGDEE